MKLYEKVLLNILLVSAVLFISGCRNKEVTKDVRMEKWRDARFGMFIHWGLYSIPAGEWKGETGYAEWIRNSAHIPIDVYDKFTGEFNPVKFNAEHWVKMAKDAGMKYIVITTKHHDGFCLFDSKYTDFDIMPTPFKRDIMKEMAEACKKQGIKICWYYSIMDWHNPDYLPRRGWEKDRNSQGANFDRYVKYMKNQLKELLTNYGPIEVLWFDGEWEETWNRQRGRNLLKFVRKIDPDIIVNNRVGAGRTGMTDSGKNEELTGDFGTPEQHIPDTGLPGVDWETCMTMNDHWGYNKHDKNWKSAQDLIRKLADIASKGGNFLLNVGPKSDGTFPDEAKIRLKKIGEWMRVNGESIYGTKASPFKKLKWGRCTQKHIGNNARLYLHIFLWPGNRKLVLNGIYNKPLKAYLLSDSSRTLSVEQKGSQIIIILPAGPVDPINTVVVLDIEGLPDIDNPPEIVSDFDIFTDSLRVSLYTGRKNISIRYTVNGKEPCIESSEYKAPFYISRTTSVKAGCFRNGRPVSGISAKNLKKVSPLKSKNVVVKHNGVNYSYFEGAWDSIPDFSRLDTVRRGCLNNFSIDNRLQDDNFGFVFKSFIKIPKTEVYGFSTDSDDGSRLFIDNKLIVDNNGLHGLQKAEGFIPLAKGFHSLRVEYFEKGGGNELYVRWRKKDKKWEEINSKYLFPDDK